MIKDKNFLEFEYMPPFQKKEDMAGWLAKNEPMRYVWDKARRVLVFNPDTKTWQGVNYGKSERVLLSNHKGISRRNKKIFETAEKCKLDLMPPQLGRGHIFQTGTSFNLKKLSIRWPVTKILCICLFYGLSVMVILYEIARVILLVDIIDNY